jgi:hypothetical protein
VSSATLTPLGTLTPTGLLLVHLSLTITVTDKATGEDVFETTTDPTKYTALRSENVKEFPLSAGPGRCRSRPRSMSPAAATPRARRQSAPWRSWT